MYYMLGENNEVVVTTDIVLWGAWFETADKHVARSKILDHDVSTVFLGVDHSLGSGPPLLFETMIFEDGDMSGVFTRRYSTYAEALEGHEESIREFFNVVDLDGAVEII